MAKEIDNLQIALNDPPRPYIAILGGTKCDDSLRVAKNLIDKEIIDSIPVVGVVGNMMLWASGVDIGEGNKSFIRNTLGDAFEETWEMAVYLHDNHSEYFLLPADVAVELNGDRVAMMVDDLPTDNPIYDIGIQTLQEISPLLINAGCILWNGPASYFELPGFAFGTIEILNMCIESSAVTIVGGGHTSSLVSNRGAVDQVTHNSHDNHSEYFLLPADVAVELNGDRVAMMVDDLPTGNPIYDIGIQTLQEISPLLINAGCILWNGPASYFELPGFAFGTIEILNMCIESSAVTIVGGGHTSSLVSNRGAVDQVTHNSTGGGACLTMLSGGFMPVIDSLNRSNTKFRPILDALGIKK